MDLTHVSQILLKDILNQELRGKIQITCLLTTIQVTCISIHSTWTIWMAIHQQDLMVWCITQVKECSRFLPLLARKVLNYLRLQSLFHLVRKILKIWNFLKVKFLRLQSLATSIKLSKRTLKLWRFLQRISQPIAIRENQKKKEKATMKKRRKMMVRRIRLQKKKVINLCKICRMRLWINTLEAVIFILCIFKLIIKRMDIWHLLHLECPLIWGCIHSIRWHLVCICLMVDHNSGKGIDNNKLMRLHLFNIEVILKVIKTNLWCLLHQWA